VTPAKRAAAVLLPAGALALIAAAGPASGSAPQARAAKTKVVTVGDDAEGNLFFKPRRVTITAGDKVKWVWTGTLEHRVVGKSVRSKLRAAPYSYRKRFKRPTKPGRPRKIICAIHPSMRMRLRVKSRE
jgi:plastocyanin